MRSIGMCLGGTLLLMCLASPVDAHFLWIVAGIQSPDRKLHVYFSESAAPDDPALLDRVAGLTVQQVWAGEMRTLTLVKGHDSWEATATDQPVLYQLQHIYGVVTRGQEKFLLHYYARCYSSDQPQTWIPIEPAHQLPLDVTPRLEGTQTILTALWQGKPLQGAQVTIHGEHMEPCELTTDQRGEVAAELPLGQRYSIRVKHVEQRSGQHRGQEYQSVRHYTTLALLLPKASVTSGLPALDTPVTSFGAAIIHDELYVYGGHKGQAHHYSVEGQSDRFLRLNLKQPQAWEDLGAVPPRTGLAMVAYQGKLYRFGGFVARNREPEEQLLESLADVAEYDPRSRRWTDLTPLPQGRSSHDAVVLGDQVYVVGGWMLQGSRDAIWHHTLAVANLNERPLVWKEIEMPFRRRALAVAAWKGQLLVIGGMQESGGPTTETMWFDVARGSWTPGPHLVGNVMDGFGPSACSIGDDVYVSTMSGKLQRLTADGSRWLTVAQMSYPRFFHRMLNDSDQRFILVGGASMRTGKVSALELWPVAGR